MLASTALVAFVAVSSFAASGPRPTAPPKVVAVPGDHSAVVHWRAAHALKSPITRYRVSAYLGGVVKVRKSVGRVTQTAIGGLQNGKRYTFRVTALNANGSGPARASQAVTIGSPAAPTHVTSKSVSAGMRVRWHAPGAKNGSRISGYVVIPHANGRALPARRYASSAVSQVVTGLKIGKTYAFTVAARNGFGTGPASRPSAARQLACIGVPMRSGQGDINSHPGGTTFCLSGVHNWNLHPKSGNRLIGPAVLDGAGSTRFAVEAGSANNVVLSGLEIRNYMPGYQLGAVQTGYSTSGWVLRDLRVHDIGNGSGGVGVNLGPNWHVYGGRFYNNRQEGFTNTYGRGVVIDGAEIDHNNFTNDAHTTANVSCAADAGGYKWVADNVTVKNSRIHDNACVGLWMDINARGAKIVNNRVYNNWAEGIFIEISHSVNITRNVVRGNGFRSFRGSCRNLWLYGGGITLAASDGVTVTNNTVSGNCNGITGTQENRPDGHPGLLENISVQHNTVAGPGGKLGVGAYPRKSLAGRNITFANNTAKNGMRACGLNCG